MITEQANIFNQWVWLQTVQYNPKSRCGSMHTYKLNIPQIHISGKWAWLIKEAGLLQDSMID